MEFKTTIQNQLSKIFMNEADFKIFLEDITLFRTQSYYNLILIRQQSPNTSFVKTAKLRVQEIVKKSIEEEFKTKQSETESNGQLTVKDLRQLLKQIDEFPLPEEEKDQLQIYLGDDEVLNGIHSGWTGEIIDFEADFLTKELILENSNNYKPKKQWIVLIS